MFQFTDPDTADYYDAWRMSLLKHEPTRMEIFGAGWNSAMRAVKEWRDHEAKIADAERREAARWEAAP
jgi:hypothetical protein